MRLEDDLLDRVAVLLMLAQDLRVERRAIGESAHGGRHAGVERALVRTQLRRRL